MKMAIRNGQVILVDVDMDRQAKIRASSLMQWNRTQQALCGPATAELMNFLADLMRLPAPAEQLRQELNQQKTAIDAQRTAADPVPLCDYPVKKQLYRHQIRGANMAMLAFGLVDPPEESGN